MHICLCCCCYYCYLLLHIRTIVYTYILIHMCILYIYTGCTEKAEFVKKLQETEHLEM